MCTTPRTGSGYLCDTLWRTGYFGRPDEYFCDEGFHREYATEDDRCDLNSYIQKVRRLAIGNGGVLGVKIMWDHFRKLADSYRTHNECPALTNHETSMRIFANPKFIWLRRKNKFYQAASLYKRRMTGVYSIRDSSINLQSCPAPSTEDIDNLVEWLEVQDSGWADFFKQGDIEPLEIHYESLKDNVECSVSQIADYLNIRFPNTFSIPKSNYQTIADDETENWITAYKAEKNQ